ncbi:MAG: TlpA family protein disulfide reductase [Lachnospiraceae bacterium]|nr:TlpA family protein disulfide reductase [Lachnospiraceae bacterium]
MNNKKTLIALCIVFVVLLCGAGALYNFLGDKVERDALVVTIPQGTPTVSPTETAMPTQAQETVSPTETIEPTQAPGENDAQAEEEVDYSAPDFTVVDAEGIEHKLSDFRGKPVILNFWASWCGPCKSEMPDFEEVYQEYKDDIHFLMVNLTDGYQETVESASKLITGKGYTFPVYFDTKLEAANAYYVYSIPQTFFIDADGNLVAYAQSAISKEILYQGIGMIEGVR